MANFVKRFREIHFRAYFILGGLWPQIKSNTILFTSSTKIFGLSITLQINTSLESARDFTRFILP